MLISLPSPFFDGLQNGKERDKRGISLNDCSWMAFPGLSLLVIAVILILSHLYVTGIQMLAVLWGYLWIILWGRSQRPPSCTVSFLERRLVEAHPLPTSASFMGSQLTALPAGFFSLVCSLLGGY